MTLVSWIPTVAGEDGEVGVWAGGLDNVLRVVNSFSAHPGFTFALGVRLPPPCSSLPV